LIARERRMVRRKRRRMRAMEESGGRKP